MSLTTSKLLPASETAHALRLLLWPRQWRDFLADCARGRPGLGGWLTLEPFAIDEQRHPLYNPADVRAFVEAARVMKPTRKPTRRVESQRYVHDDTIGLPWKMRVAKPSTGGARTHT